jgi:rRNA-processing protein FCF1
MFPQSFRAKIRSAAYLFVSNRKKKTITQCVYGELNVEKD